MKQILRLLGGLILLAAALTVPVLTCVQKSGGAYRETDAVVTRVESHQSKGRRGRVSTHYNLRYTYAVEGAQYDGYDPNYRVDGDTREGDKVRVLYKQDQPGDSRISEGGGQNWWQTLVLLALAGYLFFGFWRNRR